MSSEKIFLQRKQFASAWYLGENNLKSISVQSPEVGQFGAEWSL